jgi:hypothetical protein
MGRSREWRAETGRECGLRIGDEAIGEEAIGHASHPLVEVSTADRFALWDVQAASRAMLQS